MGIFGKSREKVVDGAVKLVGNVREMIDQSTLTAEEKAAFTASFVENTLSENTERSRTRRSIAVDTVRFYFLLIVFLIATWKFDAEWFNATKTLIVDFKLPVVFIMIMAFFFGGYYVSDGIKKWKGRKK